MKITMSVIDHVIDAALKLERVGQGKIFTDVVVLSDYKETGDEDTVFKSLVVLGVRRKVIVKRMDAYRAEIIANANTAKLNAQQSNSRNIQKISRRFQ